ncbi:MAG: 16S rRNA (uracil(1498)-N(3))-methyltransferase [Deltaproteobacteria bacterium]
MSKVRLFLDQPMGQGQGLSLAPEQAHYLFGVMRLGVGDVISTFNGRDGEWQARVETVAKRGGSLVCLEQSATQRDAPDLWLIFAPIKKARTDFIVEKATELGIARIFPVETQHTNSERIRQDRLQAHAVEAAEQCGGTYVPVVEDIRSLPSLLANWPDGRTLVFCDETLTAETADWSGLASPAAILIGPEGGFSEKERAALRALPYGVSKSLGPRILRADTAACAAITLWQAANGDWT